MRARTVYSRVGVEAGLDSVEEGRRATAAVLHALRDRLTREEAAQAAAQLPRELKALWRAGEVPGRRPLRMHRREFMERVKLAGGLPSLRKAETAVDAVFAALKDQISEGELEDIAAQLPGDLKTVWGRA